MQAQAEKRRHRDPSHASDNTAYEHQIDLEPTGANVVDHHHGRTDGAPHELSLDADIPELDPKGDCGGKTDENKRRPLEKDVGEAGAVEERKYDEFFENVRDVDAGDDQQEHGYSETDDDGREHDQPVHPELDALTYLQTDAADS